MKANELMIGDWVRNALLGEVFKMNTISMRNMCWDEDNGTMRYSIEPIPLTAEILEKNGFRFYKAVGEIHPYYYIPHRYSMKCTTNGDLHFYLDCIGADIRIYYVHELQHALRLCGLNDLADNFKI